MRTIQSLVTKTMTTDLYMPLLIVFQWTVNRGVLKIIGTSHETACAALKTLRRSARGV